MKEKPHMYYAQFQIETCHYFKIKRFVAYNESHSTWMRAISKKWILNEFKGHLLMVNEHPLNTGLKLL